MGRRGKRLAIATAAVIGLAAVATTTAVYALGGGEPNGNGVPAGSPSPATVGMAPTIASNCKVGKADIVTLESTQSTTSTSYVSVPGMSKSVKMSKGCIIAVVSDWPFAAGGELLYIRVTVDGATGSPAEVQFSGDDDENSDGKWARSHSAQFVFVVPKGPHTVSLEWKSFFGGTVFLHTPVMVIYHP
jgi:hypothetical protein